MIQIKTAMTIIEIDPGNLFEIFVYHSGKKRYTDVTNNKMGIQNNTAIGKPAISFDPKLFNRSLSFSHEFIKS